MPLLWSRGQAPGPRVPARGGGWDLGPVLRPPAVPKASEGDIRVGVAGHRGPLGGGGTLGASVSYQVHVFAAVQGSLNFPLKPGAADGRPPLGGRSPQAGRLRARN